MFQLVQDTTVTLSHINVRTEKHGPADVDAFDLDFALTGENRKLLALLHPRLCESLFFNAEREAGQEVAEGVDDSVPNLRFTRLADALPWSDEAAGVAFDGEAVAHDVPWDTDPRAATRRAIVLAAADMAN